MCTPTSALVYTGYGVAACSRDSLHRGAGIKSVDLDDFRSREIVSHSALCEKVLKNKKIDFPGDYKCMVREILWHLLISQHENRVSHKRSRKEKEKVLQTTRFSFLMSIIACY